MTDEEMNEYLQKQFGNIGDITKFVPSDEGGGYVRYNVDPAFRRTTEFGPGIGGISVGSYSENIDPLATEYGIIPNEHTATPTSYVADLTAPAESEKGYGYYAATFNPQGKMLSDPQWVKAEKHRGWLSENAPKVMAGIFAAAGGYALLPEILAAGAGVGGMTAAEAAAALGELGINTALGAEAAAGAGALGAGASEAALGELGAGAISEAALGELGINTALTASDLAANTGLAEVLASTNSQAALGELGINTNGGLFNSISQFGNTLSQIPRNIGTFFLPEAPAGVQTALGNLITNTALNGGDIEAAAKGSLFSSLGSLAGPLGAQLAPGLDRTVQDYLGKFIINTVQSGGDVEKALKSLATSALTGKVTEITGLPKEASSALIQAARTGNLDPTRIATTLATNYLTSPNPINPFTSSKPPSSYATGGNVAASPSSSSQTGTAMDDFFDQGYYDDSNARFNQRYQRFDGGGEVDYGLPPDESIPDVDYGLPPDESMPDPNLSPNDPSLGELSIHTGLPIGAPGGAYGSSPRSGNSTSAADNNPLVNAIARSFGISPNAAKLALGGLSAAAGAALLPATINKGMTPTGLQALPTEGLKGPATQQVATGATGTGGRGSVRHFATVPVGTAAPAPVGPPKVYGRTGIEYASPEAARAAGEFNFTLNRPVGVTPPPPASPNYGDLVTAAYGNVGRSGFGTDPNQIDQAGYDYWMQQFQSGNVTPETFSDIFQSADAAQANNRNLVTAAYGNVGRSGFGTDPNQIDQAGFDYWMQQFQAGNVTPETFSDIFQSADAYRTAGDREVHTKLPFDMPARGVSTTLPFVMPDYTGDPTSPDFSRVDPRESDPLGFGYDPNAVREFARGGGISDVVYGPDGTAYKSEAQARASGVTDVMSARSRMRPMRSNFEMRPSTSMGDYSGGDVAKARGGAINQGLGYLRSSEDGMADRIEAVIDNRQPAKLSGGEFVIPADVVSHLGNGNSDAGAKQLHDFMSRIRKARTGNPKQGRRITPTKYLPK